jgi:hypothetical protein
VTETGNGSSKAADLTLTSLKFSKIATVSGKVVGGTSLSGTLILQNTGIGLASVIQTSNSIFQAIRSLPPPTYFS